MAEEKQSTSFGFNAIGKETPMWAKWIFRIIFMVSKVAIAYIAATNLVPQEWKYEVTLLITTVIEPIAYGVSKMWGINTEDK